MKEFDIKEFAEMFDAALESDNPAVQKALRNFMMVAAIVHTQEDKKIKGPLETLIDKVNNLEQTVEAIARDQIYRSKVDNDYYKQIYQSPIAWTVNPRNYSTTSISKSDIDSISDLVNNVIDNK